MVNFACNLLADGRYVAVATGVLGSFYGEPKATTEEAWRSADAAYRDVEAVKAEACRKLGLPEGASVAAIISAAAKLPEKKSSKKEAA